MRSLLCALATTSLLAPSRAAPMFKALRWPRPPRQSGPTVALDYITVQGKTSTSDGESIDSFLGVPFASPPTGDLRLRLPTPPHTYPGVYDATSYGSDCVQQQVTDSGALGNLPSDVLDLLESIPGSQAITNQDEDCLFVNVIRPSNATSDSKLPVLFWIYGGGFEEGGTSTYDGSPIVGRAISNGLPLIYVSANYRVAGYGFLPGKEVKEAGVGNIGLFDQRFALKWTNKYISQFGGDPDKVTIWGESAGSISVALQMLTEGGSTGGLFRGGYMNSGSPIAIDGIDDANGQAVYDTVVNAAGCANSTDTLECLRHVDNTTFQTAVDQLPGLFSYESTKLAHEPRVDGNFLEDDPQKLVIAGKYAKIPIVNGDCDDEGTLFTLVLTNITTDDEFTAYVRYDYFAPEITDAEIAELATLYPQDPTQGSPYDTGLLNAITPEYKRIASVQGDLIFEGPRRLFLSYTSKTQPTWSYLNKRLKATPILGSLHGSDLLQYYYSTTVVPQEALDYLINFSNNLDPNVGANPNGWLADWPQYGANKTMLLFSDTNVTGVTTGELSLTTDTFREAPIAYVQQLSLKYPN